MRGLYAMILLCAALLVLSCAESNRDKLFKGKEIEVSGAPIDITESGEMLDPTELLCFDSLVIVKNSTRADFVFTVIDGKNGKLLKHLLKYGKGPGEIAQGFFFQKSRKDRSVEFFVGSDKTFMTYNIDSALNNNKYYPHIVDRIETQPAGPISESGSTILYLRRADDTLYIADGMFRDGNRFGLYNKNGTIVGSYLSYPDNDNGVDPKLKFMVYHHGVRFHPTKNLFTTVFLNSDWLEICQIKDNSIEQVFEYHTYLPSYFAGDAKILIVDKNSRLGNFYMDVNQSNIFVTEDMRTASEARSVNRILPMSNFVYAYDWSGQPVRKLVLDKQIIAFTVDEKNEFLYGLVYTPDLTIIKYDLRKVF